MSKMIAASVFVNGRSRTAIMEDMRARIVRADLELERHDAIQVDQPIRSYTPRLTMPCSQAMCDIAADRAKKLVSRN